MKLQRQQGGGGKGGGGGGGKVGDVNGNPITTDPAALGVAQLFLWDYLKLIQSCAILNGFN